jgi:ABC-type Zn uptake system ZnuABC Zn-binding protein ZnuA
LSGWLFCAFAGFAGAAPIEVVTSTEDLKNLVEVVGAEGVRVTTLVAGSRDAEDYVARPQDLLQVKRAQVVVRIGLDYDVWLDALIKKSANSRVQKGAPGYVDTSQGMMLLDVQPRGLSDAGHGHGIGNPHYWLDPKNAELMTAHILLALADAAPQDAKRFEAQRTAFLDRLKQRETQWLRRMQPLQGRALIAYHNSWPYLARRLQLNFVGTIEPRPGVAPPPAHLARLLDTAKKERVAGIVIGTREPRRDAEFLAKKLGVPIIVLAESVGATPAIQSYADLMEFNVAALETLMTKVQR